jgi:uncharacterized membrane protein required for colicin V production
MDTLSAPVVDLAIFLGLFFFIILGVMQGSIRRILGLISFLFAFLVAASLRDPVGNILANNWTQYTTGYNHLLAFVGLFIVGAVGLSILIQGFYRRTDIYAKHPIVDDIIGGSLGFIQGMLLLTVVVIVLNSYTLTSAESGDVGILRQVQDLIHKSAIAGGVKDVLAPPLVHVLAFFLPSDLVAAFP